MKQNRRNLLGQIGLAGIGLSFSAALAGCYRRDHSPALNLYTWDTYGHLEEWRFWPEAGGLTG